MLRNAAHFRKGKLPEIVWGFDFIQKPLVYFSIKISSKTDLIFAMLFDLDRAMCSANTWLLDERRLARQTLQKQIQHSGLGVTRGTEGLAKITQGSNRNQLWEPRAWATEGQVGAIQEWPLQMGSSGTISGHASLDRVDTREEDLQFVLKYVQRLHKVRFMRSAY